MKQLSSIISSNLGNMLEWYDFGLFTIFSALFSRLFFPTTDPHTALVATFSIFSIGFLCRPIGALIFGYVGDKSGRAISLRLSILMISLPTLLIGCLPSYQQIGFVAPVLLVIIRMWQGISIGGEYSGNLIYLAETAPNQHRALFTSFASMGANLGILLAAMVGIIASRCISTEALQTWGWRIPYLISGILCLIIYKFRLRISETDVFEYLKKHHKLAVNPIKTVFKDNKLQLLRTLGIVCMGTTFYYFSFSYLPLYLSQQLQYSVQYVSLIMLSCIGTMILLVPMAGYVCDRVGRRQMLLLSSAFVMLATIPGFYFLLSTHYTTIMLILAIFTLISSLEQGVTSIAVVENFPPTARYTGVSFGYNIGNGFLGGTVPIVCTWLIASTHVLLVPAFYITFFAAVTWMVVYYFVPETKGESLETLTSGSR